MARPKGSTLTPETILNEVEARLSKSMFNQLSMSEIAKHLGIKTPSLYSHFTNLDDLKDCVTYRGLSQLALALRGAMEGQSGRAKLIAFMKAYRSFAHRHPLLFDATQFGIHRGNPTLMEAADSIVQLAIQVLESWKIPESRLVHAVRTLRSLLNGFIALELQGGFQRNESPDDSFEELIEFTERGLNGYRT